MSSRPKIALISIGQTPRPDITTDYYHMGCGKFDIVEFGALDGCCRTIIEQLAPLATEADLVTRLADGSPVRVSHQRLTPYVQQAVDRAITANATVIVVQCTGHFTLQCTGTLIYPGQVLEKSASLLAGKGHSLLLLIPTPGQTEQAEARWRSRGYTIAATRVIGPFDQPQICPEVLKGDNVLTKADALIADCYGFTNGFYQQIRACYSGPILIPRRLIAGLLISGWQ